MAINEEQDIRNWNKNHPYNKEAKNLAELCLSLRALCRVELRVMN